MIARLRWRTFRHRVQSSDGLECVAFGLATVAFGMLLAESLYASGRAFTPRPSLTEGHNPTERISPAAADLLFDFTTDRGAAPVSCANGDGNRILVRFDRGHTPAEIKAHLDGVGLPRHRKVSPLNLYVVETETPGNAPDLLLQQVRALPLRTQTTIDCQGRGGEWDSSTRTTETWASEQWHLDNETGADIDAPEAWSITTGSSALVVATIDSGVASDHPDLIERTYRSADDPMNDADDEGDGWVDDESGWDFIGADELADDEHNHGSWVAGVLAADADNQFGVVGIDHAAQVVPLKILDETNRGYTSDLIAALDYALVHPEIRIVNLSLIDFPDDPMLHAAVRALSTQAILVACAGNAGPGTADQQFPGAYPETISVGWTDRNDQIAPASSSGTTVDVTAPGLDIRTLAPGSTDDEFEIVSGCSFATPQVSGALSLTLAVRPETDLEDALFLLSRTVHDLGAVGWDEDFGWGRLDMDDLLVEAQALISQDGFESGGLARWQSSNP